MPDKQQYYPLSFSSLKAFSRSPLAFMEYKAAKREPTPAMEFGTLVHMATLEPDKYRTEVAIWDGRRAGNEYKSFVEENPDKRIITPKLAMDVRTAHTRLQENGLSCGLLGDLDMREKRFRIDHCGIPHTGFIDGLNRWAVIDLKVTARVDHHSLQRTIWDFKYYMQAAIYMRAAEMLGYRPEAYFIIAVESAAPHHVNVVELEPHYIARGHIEWEKLLDRFKEWDGQAHHSHDVTAGYTMMDAPAWVPAMELDGDKLA